VAESNSSSTLTMNADTGVLRNTTSLWSGLRG
jgi:hypothetical protein